MGPECGPSGRSAEAQEHYQRIATDLAEAIGATPGKMMGMPTLYLGGKAFAGLLGDAMVFRLDGEAHAASLALPAAVLFDPSGMGRPMGFAPAPHRHRDSIEAFYVLDGRHTFTADGEEVAAEAGTFVLVPKRVTHSYVVGPGPWRILVFSRRPASSASGAR